LRPLRITIIGCGWLGLPLLQALVTDGHTVRGTSRNQDTLDAIAEAGGIPHFLDLPQPPPKELLEGIDLLIIALPPGGRRLGRKATEHYLACLSVFQPWLVVESSPHVLFTSSTGVYGAATGVVTEETPLTPETHSARAVAAAEAWLTTQPAPLTILRLAGLTGPGRHPGRFFGGRDRPIPQADAPVNLVLQADVIAAVRTLLPQRLPTGVFNVCAAAHPTKGEFYTAAAHQMGLTVAGAESGGATGKIISSESLRQLGWQPTCDTADCLCSMLP